MRRRSHCHGHARPQWGAAGGDGQRRRVSAQTYVDSLATRLRDTDIEAEGRARIGDVVPTIGSVADEIDADLIVIATHGRVGAARAVLGSTADAVVRTARRPVPVNCGP